MIVEIIGCISLVYLIVGFVFMMLYIFTSTTFDIYEAVIVLLVAPFEGMVYIIMYLIKKIRNKNHV
jgi:hypothetical protein